ncbi:uncharacterized protein LOC107817872 isoform X2 [Nicotiana tabacum]|uniref:Uncharacterized protein LOC107817872 isoform X2 n=2 Tax=Nicotiana TaxID=4085 RepID=A0A1S4CDR9_TOBAC|nr:PREDICTED: uncharacterized protein LOC104231708 [Nicotiana sylvestris]XP_016499256.1 PREDICTED: uncharacterized protein LOC107817872 isoform X2 [Nicotiana tabacum]
MVLRLWIILISSMIVFHHQDSAKSSGDLYLYSSKSGQNPLGLDGEYLLKVSTDFERELSMGKQNLFKSVLRLVGYGRFWGDDGRERAFLVFPLKKKGDLQRNIKGDASQLLHEKWLLARKMQFLKA